jgi:hypothetical protein
MASSRLKTTTFASGARVRTRVVVALAAAAAAAGCDGVDCPANSTAMATTNVECTAAGGAEVSSLTLGLPRTVVPGGGATTCMQLDSTCGGEAVIVFASPDQRSSDDGYIHFGFRIPAADAPGAYGLAGGTTRFGPALASDGVSYTGDLIVKSGTLIVTRNDASNLDATFAVELETTDGQHEVSLTRGAIHVGSCARVTRTACWVAD